MDEQAQLISILDQLMTNLDHLTTSLMTILNQLETSYHVLKHSYWLKNGFSNRWITSLACSLHQKVSIIHLITAFFLLFFL